MVPVFVLFPPSVLSDKVHLCLTLLFPCVCVCVCLTSVCFHTSTTYLSFSRQSYIWEHCSVEWTGMLMHKKMFFAWFCSSIAYAYLFLLCVSDISTFLHPAPSSAQIWSGMINHCISPHSCIVNPLRFFTATPSDLGNWSSCKHRVTDPPAALNHPILHVLMWKPSLVEAPSHISIPWLDLTLSQAPERKFNPVQGKRKHTQAAFLNMRLYHTYPMPQVLSLYLWRWIITCVYLKPV